MMKKRRNQLILSLLRKKDPYNDENVIEFRWSGVKEDKEDIALDTSMRAYKSKLMREIFQKSHWMIAVSYLMKRKIKNIFLEVISNIKIFYIKFF